MDICLLSTSDSPANFLVCARICLSHLNCNHANIAVAPNGFHCTVIAEYTNSCGVNERLFFLCAAERLESVLKVLLERFQFTLKG